MALEVHPFINACLNATSGVLLLAGYKAIRGGDRARHKKLQLAALTVSGVFLVSYVIRFLSTGAHKYPGSGIDKMEMILRECPAARILVLTMHDDPAYLRAALNAGASGYVVKKVADTELLNAIRAVHAGRSSFYCPKCQR